MVGEGGQIYAPDAHTKRHTEEPARDSRPVFDYGSLAQVAGGIIGKYLQAGIIVEKETNGKKEYCLGDAARGMAGSLAGEIDQRLKGWGEAQLHYFSDKLKDGSRVSSRLSGIANAMVDGLLEEHKGTVVRQPGQLLPAYTLSARASAALGQEDAQKLNGLLEKPNENFAELLSAGKGLLENVKSANEMESKGPDPAAEHTSNTTNVTNVRIPNPFSMQTDERDWNLNLNLGGGYGFNSGQVSGNVGIGFANPLREASIGLEATAKGKPQGTLGWTEDATVLRHSVAVGRAPLSSIGETSTGFGYQYLYSGQGRAGFSSKSTTPAVMARILQEADVVKEGTAVSVPQTTGLGSLPFFSGLASIAYSIGKRLHEATGLFSFLFSSDVPKALKSKDRQRKIENVEELPESKKIRELVGKINEKLESGKEGKAGKDIKRLQLQVLENLARLAQYSGVRQEDKEVLHRQFYGALMYASASGLLRLDQMEAYANSPLAIKFSRLERANLDMALDRARIANASGVNVSTLTGTNAAAADKLLEGMLGVFVKEYSIGLPVGMVKHGANFVEAIIEDVRIANPFSWLNLAGNLWEYLSPVYNRREARVAQVQRHIREAIRENEREFAKPDEQRNNEAIFANMLYLRGYFGNSGGCRALLGASTENVIKGHFESNGRKYALNTLAIICADEELRGSIGQMAVESLVYMEQGKSRTKFERQTIEAANRMFGDEKEEYKDVLALLASPAGKSEGAFDGKMKKFLAGDMKGEELEEFYKGIRAARVFCDSSLAVTKAYENATSPWKDEIATKAKAVGNGIAAELQKDMKKINWEKAVRLLNALELMETVNPACKEEVSGKCFEAARKKMDALKVKVKNGTALSDGEEKFVLFVSDELSSQSSLGLLEKPGAMPWSKSAKERINELQKDLEFVAKKNDEIAGR